MGDGMGMLPGGRPVSRRRALAWLGIAGLGSLAAACSRRLSSARSTSSPSATATRASSGGSGSSGTAPSCVLTPELTEGPFYLPLNLVRSDITEGKEGAPLELDLQVVDATSCQPIRGAIVDIWHADALGVYSGVVPLGANSTAPSTSGTFLRGVQSTGSDGVATFQSLYPGWYQGRAVHIHVKVHLDDQTVHTGQLFFQDGLTATVYGATAPYDTRPVADTTNEGDDIYRQGGAQSTLGVKRKGSGYVGAIIMGVNR